jgi:hypothetical protein
VTATITTKPKAHLDGGTYIEIAFAETRNRWGINITRWTTYRSTVKFEVHRVSDDHMAFRLGCFDTEAEARSYANKMWRLDK